MRKCPKCGKHYDNTWKICAVDGEKLIESALSIDKNIWIRKAITFGYRNFKKEISEVGSMLVPEHNFYYKNKDMALAAQEMARDILNKLGLITTTVLVTFENNLSVPGRVELSNRECFVDISREFRFKPYSIGAILAHEIMHVFLHDKRICFGSSTEENELFTDIMTILFGLGLLVLNGFEEEVKTENTFTGTQTITTSRFLGYLQPNEFGYLSSRLLKLNNLDIGKIAKQINNPGRQYLHGGMDKVTQELDLAKRQVRFYNRNKNRISKICNRLDYMTHNCIEKRDNYCNIGFDYKLDLYSIVSCDKCFAKLRIPINKGKIKVKCKNCDYEFSAVS